MSVHIMCTTMILIEIGKRDKNIFKGWYKFCSVPIDTIFYLFKFYFMRKLFILMLISSFVFTACKKKDKTAKPDTPETMIVGTWDLNQEHEVIYEGDDIDEDDVVVYDKGSTVKFTKDNKVEVRIIFEDEMERESGTYRIQGNTLELMMGDDEDDVEEFTIKKLTKDELILFSEETWEVDDLTYRAENTLSFSK